MSYVRALSRSKSTIASLIGAGPIAELRLYRDNFFAVNSIRRAERRMRRQMSSLPDAEVATVIASVGRPSLAAAVESALAQSVADHRVIVVRDGPGSVPPLPRDERVSILVLPRHLGSAGAVRNIGMSVVRSRFVAFLDDDNTWEGHHLATSIQTLVATGADISYAACRRTREDGTEFDVLGRPWNYAALRHENWVDTSAIVVHRRHRYAWSRSPSPRHGGFGEDWTFVFWYGLRRKVVFTGAVTVNYRIRPGAIDWALTQRSRRRAPT